MSGYSGLRTYTCDPESSEPVYSGFCTQNECGALTLAHPIVASSNGSSSCTSGQILNGGESCTASCGAGFQTTSMNPIFECPLSGGQASANFACEEILCDNFTLADVTGAVGATCPNSGQFQLYVDIFKSRMQNRL